MNENKGFRTFRNLLKKSFLFRCLFILAEVFLVLNEDFSVSEALEPVNKLPKTGVTFKTNDLFLQNLYDRAVEAEEGLKTDYRPGMPALYEGANYFYFWLETQPMAGGMFAKRDLIRARNLQLIFMETQREDGRIPAAVASAAITKKRGWDLPDANMAPGQIFLPKLGVSAFFGQLQGFTLPPSALDVYYWFETDDPDYLNRLYRTLEKYDAYLWRVRDSNKDGILELWCGFDNGEDRSVRNFDAPDYWPFDFPPSEDVLKNYLKTEKLRWWPTIGILHQRGEAQDRPKLDNVRMPYQSMDVMAWSHEARRTLAEVSVLLKNGRENFWNAKADEVRQKVIASLWDPKRNACFDRDKNGETMNILLHNNLRCMWYRLFTQEMADLFIRDHLMNPDEFWTPMPLVSIAINDPLFANVSNNSWSGQPQGLTWQRAIRALENYGHYAEVSILGSIVQKRIGQTCRFRQQFDPFSGKPDDISSITPNYGPTILAILEYFSRMYGIHKTRDRICWSALNHKISGPEQKDLEFEVTQRWGDRLYRLILKDGIMTGILNDRILFTCSAGTRIITDFDGKLMDIVGIASNKTDVKLQYDGKKYSVAVCPNEVWNLEKSGKFVLAKKVPCFDPAKVSEIIKSK